LQDTGLDEKSVTHVAITLGLHLIPDPDAVLRGTVFLLDQTDLRDMEYANGC
jgi:hypothetical protein